MRSNLTGSKRADCRARVYDQMVAIAIVLFVVVAWPSIGYSDFQLGTRDGKTLVWDQFTLEDGNYCTWKKGGKFCLPQSDVVSMKEVSSDDSSGSPHQARGSSSGSSNNSGQNGGGSSAGVMHRSYNNTSGDSRGHYYGRGGSYNADNSSTSYSKEITDADIRQIELDQFTRKQESENRRLEAERRAQAARSREESRQEQMRQERESQRQRYEAERNAYRR